MSLKDDNQQNIQIELGGTGRFPITARGSGRDGRPIKRWPRRSSMSPKATAGALILIWRNFSIESITTN